MKKKRLSHEQRRYLALAVLLIVIVTLIGFAWTTPEQVRQKACANLLSWHPIRVSVTNHYEKPVWMNIDYQGLPYPTQTFAIPPGISDVIYTRQGFQQGMNATITFTAYDPDNRTALPDKQVVYQLLPDTQLVHDLNYQKKIVEQQTTTTTTTTLNLECTTEYVFDGPTVVFGV